VTRRRESRFSLRLRITAGALVVVVAAFCGAGVVVIGVAKRAMVDQIDAALRVDADYIDRSLTSGAGLPMSEGPTDLYIEFIAADGKVIGASTAAQGLPALAAPRRSDTTIDDRVDPDLGDLRVLTKPAPTNPEVTLVIARSSASVVNVGESLTRLLMAMVVGLSVLLGCIIWIVVGRSLRPVAVMSDTVNAISDRDLHRRLERPGTGDELDRLADTLNDLLERLDEGVRRERQFVADASHELRTPIAGVRALLETEPANPGEVVPIRAEALDRLGQLQDLVDQLLILAKAGEGAPAAAPDEPVDLDELVLGQARQLERSTNLRIDTSRVSGGQVLGRDTDLGRLVENLATNAARYAKTTVAFSVRHVGTMVEFTVSDDGPGIAASDRARVFERFATLDDARSRQRAGGGLGLSIASAIVTAHRGSICADDAPGPGTGAVFVVRLPASGVAGPR
jgi:signal transduction histidine kinase